MRAVNLLPAERKKRERSAPKLTPVHLAGLGIVVGAVALGYWGHSIHGQVDQKAAQLADLEQQTTTLTAQVAAAKAAAVQTSASTYEADKALVSGIANARVNWSTVMINLSRVAPSDVSLASMSVTAPTGSQTAQATGTGTTADRPAAITLQASASSRTSAALFVARLAAIPGFVEPRISGGINPGGGTTSGTGTATGPVRYTFTVEIPVDDNLFGSGPKPAATTTAPTTATPTQP